MLGPVPRTGSHRALVGFCADAATAAANKKQHAGRGIREDLTTRSKSKIFFTYVFHTCCYFQRAPRAGGRDGRQDEAGGVHSRAAAREAAEEVAAARRHAGGPAKATVVLLWLRELRAAFPEIRRVPRRLFLRIAMPSEIQSRGARRRCCRQSAGAGSLGGEQTAVRRRSAASV